VASSVIDSRTTPNHPRVVQGTSIYDVGSPESRAVPPLTPSYVITSVANASGGTTAYTGTFTVAAIPVNSIMEVAGFITNPSQNNGVFQVVSVTATTLTLLNTAGIAEANAATAIPYFPVDSRVSPNVPVDSRVSPNIPLNSRV
jgi:hypothetical protein